MRDTFRLGGSTIAPSLNEISSAGRVTRVRPKSMDVLVWLAERAGDVVSRAEILDGVWGDVAVSADTLTQAIVELRKAFGDDRRRRRIIETIPRRGYRLLPAVERDTAARHLDAQASRIAPASRDALLWGRYHFSKWDRDGLFRARDFFERAAAADPGYAAAHAWTALCYVILGYFHHLPREAAYARARAAASASFALDKDLGEAQLTIGVIAFSEGNWVESEQAHLRAVRLAPNLPWTHWGFAWLLTSLARHDEAIAGMLRAVALDPLNPYLHTSVGEMYWFAGRPADALREYERTLALEPAYRRAWDLTVMLYESRRMYAEAIETRRRRAAAAQRADDAAEFARDYEQGGEQAYLRRLLLRLSGTGGAGHPRGAHEPSVPRPAVLAGVHARLGDADRALQLLESDLDPMLMTCPHYGPLRRHPRYQQLLRRLGLEPPAGSETGGPYG